jgi:hypothetical protein
MPSSNPYGASLYTGNPSDLGPPLPPPTFNTSNHVPAQSGHTSYLVTQQIRFWSGLEIVPPAGPIQPAVGNNPPNATQAQEVRIQSPGQVRIVWWSARREDGTLPNLPHPQPGALLPGVSPPPPPSPGSPPMTGWNEVLLRGWITQDAPGLDEAGSNERAITVSGCYIYGLKLPRQTSDGLYFPILVTDNATYGQFQLQQAQFVYGVLGPSQGGGTPDPAGFVQDGGETGLEGLFPPLPPSMLPPPPPFPPPMSAG